MLNATVRKVFDEYGRTQAGRATLPGRIASVYRRSDRCRRADTYSAVVHSWVGSQSIQQLRQIENRQCASAVHNPDIAISDC